jgi:hypothetical protein
MVSTCGQDLSWLSDDIYLLFCLKGIVTTVYNMDAVEIGGTRWRSWLRHCCLVVSVLASGTQVREFKPG